MSYVAFTVEGNKFGFSYGDGGISNPQHEFFGVNITGISDEDLDEVMTFYYEVKNNTPFPIPQLIVEFVKTVEAELNRRYEAEQFKMDGI